jgi:hypothetical protein
MADPRVNVVTATDKKMSVAPEQVDRARQAGARQLSDEESNAYLEQHARDQAIIEPLTAEAVGVARGAGEAFGVPMDKIATGIGGERARNYLDNLQRNNPYASGAGELIGQGATLLAGGEGGLASKAATRTGRILGGAAEGAAKGALENLVIGSTHDVNEAALGNADDAAEKLLARMPSHIALGAGFGGAMGGAGAAVGEAWAGIARKAPGVLNHASDALIGREFGGGAELGAELRGKVGGVPRSAAEVADTLGREQAVYRGMAEAETLGARDSLAARQTTEAWQQTARQEARRTSTLKEAKEAVDELTRQHSVAREALATQHGEAASAAVKLGEERAAAQSSLKNLASELDKVKGATFPEARNILNEATAAFQAKAPGLAPPSPRALQLFGEWTESFSARYAEPGSLTFTELKGAIKSLDAMEVRQRVVSGWGNDPEVKRAFDTLRSAAKAEFDAASEATAASVSEAKGLSASRLRESIPSLDKAHGAALENVDNIQRAIIDFDKQAAQEARIAQREAALDAKSFEKGVKAEDRDLARTQKAEEKTIPKSSKETPVDTLLGRVKNRPAKEGMGAAPMMGALLSLLHGNVAGAALSAAVGFGSHVAKAEGNLLAARTLRALAEHVASSDQAISRLAGRAVGRYVRQGAEVASEDRHARKEISFEKASKQVRDQNANPLIIEQQVRTAAGPWAQQAPNVYQALLAAKMRQQEFLYSKLPPERVDPYSPTPHLEKDDLSDTEKYDFIQYYKASADPIAAMREVIDGQGSPEQVEAVAYIYPGIYKQTNAEVDRHLTALQAPLDYERLVNIGVLLQRDTAEVMTSECQSVLADMYTERAKEEEKPAGGSAPRGVNSRLSKSMSSAGQQIAIGEV